MERKFKPVAMRFMQEAFDKMDKSGMEIHNITSFEEHYYLVNNYRGKKLIVTNINEQALRFCDPTVIETCDPKLFRQFCGLENSVEEDLKEAISKNKRGVGITAIRLMQGSLDEEHSDFEKAKTNQSCIQNMNELEKNLFSAMDVLNLLKEEYRKNPNEANFKKSLKAIAEHHKRNNKSYDLIKELEKLAYATN